MCRFAGAVIALDHHPAIVREPSADRQRRVRIENIGCVVIRYALIGFAEGGDFHIRVDPERLAHLDGFVGGIEHGRAAGVGLDVGNVCHRSILTEWPC